MPVRVIVIRLIVVEYRIEKLQLSVSGYMPDLHAGFIFCKYDIFISRIGIGAASGVKS